MEKIYTTVANLENWYDVRLFIEEHIEKISMPKTLFTDIIVACEEIFVNICSYAYSHQQNPGHVSVEFFHNTQSNQITFTFTDTGKEFDPTQYVSPQTETPLEEKEEGGFGIFLAKKIMDSLQYQYSNNQNILKLIKKI